MSVALRVGVWVVVLGAVASSGCALRPAVRAEAVRPPRDLVVLVHGMGRSALSMAPMELALRRAGYRVLNVGYSSTGPGVAEIGAAVSAAVARAGARERPGRVHFVGHSLGTVVIRWVLAHERPATVGRVVLLAPPNRGARVADRLTPYLGWYFRPMRELRTTGSTAVGLPAPCDVEVAVIAGAGDRKVRVDETRLPCLAAHEVVPGGHTFLMMRRDVIRRTRCFLGTGALDCS
jgi:triacylglycerol lipase